MDQAAQGHSNAPLAKGERPNIGFVLSHEQFAVPRLVELGIEAEKAGFDAVWGSDHFHPWQDNEGHAGFVWVTLAALGGKMPRISLGTGVTCPTYRYRPPIVAQAFTSLSLLYPGRIFLGVGTGEALNEKPASGSWGEYEERAERLVEAIGLIRKLWTGERVDHRGKYYTVEGAKLYDVPPQPIPIYMAASGEESLALAGEHGDGLITDAKTLMDPALMDKFRQGAQGAGKDPETMPIIIEQWAVVGDEEEAKRGAKLWHFLPKAWESYVNNPDPTDIRQSAEAEIPLEEVYKDWAVSRDPQVHVQAIQKLLDAGATTVFVHSPQEDQSSVINFYSKEVLPRLR